MFLPFLVLVFFAGPVITAKVPVCTGLRYTGTFVSCETGKEFYSYGFDLSVSINPNNSTFPNKLRITNYENWSSDPDNIYPGAPIIFPTKGVSIQCSTINETCLLDFPNDSTQMLYPLMVNESLGYPQSNAAIFINNGNIFDAYYGGLLDPILGNRLGWNDPYCPTQYQQAAVCTDFYYINVPEDNYGKCLDFKSVTTLTDPNKNVTATLNADYLVTSTGFNITITNFTSSVDGFAYELGPNIHYWRGVAGNTKNPIQSFPLGIGGPNYQLEWTIDFALPGSYGYWKVIAGEIIRRNDIFYYNDSIPYTVADPCFKLSYEIPFNKNAIVQTEFCCTLFATE